MIKFYYGPEAQVLEIYRVSPAPQISISTEFNYANDTIIGYSYVISINGVVATLNETYIESLENDEVYQEESPADGLLITENELILIAESETILYGDDPNSIDRLRSIRTILSGIENIRKLFSRNGSALTIRDDQNNNLLRAKGGILQSISFNNSQNQWTSTCPYSIQLQFNELEILDESILCADSLIHPSSITSNLVDITKYKIKNFSDSWSFAVDEPIYNHIGGNALDVINSEIAISYSLSATGKNYFIEDQLSPGWIQAKNFVQKRLYDQVRNLATALTMSSDHTLATLHANDGDGLISGITSSYGIYNETLSCDTSESEGTFQIQYNAILKRNYESNYCASNVKHTFNKNITTSTDGAKNNISINIDGEVEGLCEGGLLQSFGAFSFPQYGTILQAGSTSTKYNNANSFLSKIINTNLDDLESSYKTDLNITTASLELGSAISPCEEADLEIKPSSFSITRNFMTGSISYSAQYSSDRSCTKTQPDGETIFKTSITVDEPVPIISEFTIPNGQYIIQDIGTFTAKKITVTSEGKKNRGCCDIQEGMNAFLEDLLSSDMETLFPALEFPDESLFVLTNKSFSYNILEGSYTVNLAYICTSGCYI